MLKYSGKTLLVVCGGGLLHFRPALDELRSVHALSYGLESHLNGAVSALPEMARDAIRNFWCRTR
jgi:hypothetical protein